MEDRHPDVIVAVIDQDRNVHLVGVLLRIHALDRVALNDALDAIVAPFIRQLGQVAHTGTGDGTLVRAVRADGRGNRGKPAIGIAVDRNLVGIDIALRDEPGGAIILVILHLLAPLAVTGQPEFASPPGAAAILGLHDDIAAARKILRPAGRIKPGIVACPRPAMRHQNGALRLVAFLEAGRIGDQGRNFHAVTRRVVDQFTLAERLLGNPRTL